MNLKVYVTLIILFFSQFSQAEITISVDRTPVVVDESFKLIFESNEKVVGEPDFTPLNKLFTIINTGRRSNTQIINGDLKRSQQWILTLIANQSGLLNIPSIRFGNVASKPSSIRVVANTSTKKGNTTEDIFVEVNVDTKSSYVQAQILYTAKLYRAVQTNNASLSEPEISGGQAIINKLGDDKSFETKIKGKRYVVIQRQFVIFPQSSGPLKIEPLIFQGQTGSGSFFGFDPFGPQPKSIVKRSPGINLEIKPIPDSFTGDTWLPAKQLSIQEQWSVDPAKLKQGEATTRTLTLNANGLAASNLPEIKSNLPENLKQYPDQPEFSETSNENGITGVRHDKMAIIPTEGGDYVLPAIKIPWWNTDADKMEFAELPERTIHAITTATTETEIREQVIEEIKPVVKEVKEQDINIADTTDNQSLWKWLSLTFLILWIITIFLLWKNKKANTLNYNDTENDLSHRQYLKQLKQACATNNATMAKQALLDWARVNWPDKQITSIDAVKSFCTDDLQKKIDELNSCLYGKESKPWNGTNFIKSFNSQSFNNKVKSVSEGKLEPLYKT
jgi:oxygen tolerance protein BatD